MATKYWYNGQSLWSWLLTHGYTENKAKMIYWLMRHKCMNPEQAMAYKRTLSEKDQHARVLRAHRRFQGWTEEQIAKNLSVEEGKKIGIQKRIKKLYRNKPLREYANESGLSYSCLYWRVERSGMDIKEAISLGKRKRLEYNGKSPYELYGKGCSYIYSRVSKGWSIKDAFEVPKDSMFRYKSFNQRGYKPKI